MKKKLVFSAVAVAAVASFGIIPNFNDDFDSFYANGQTFFVITNGWQSSSTAAFVTNGGGYTGRAAFMGQTVTLTNTVSADSPLKVWTDFRIKPTFGAQVDNPQTNAASLFYYFSSNGYVVVATPSGWQTCTNDIWGSRVDPATNGYVRMSVFQDYASSNQAVFLNDQLIVQDLRFIGTAGSYDKLVIENDDSGCWLDNVWINTNVTGLASNRNNDLENKPDADELQQYGYARRTLYVCQTTTNLFPLFTNLTTAVNVWRPRDTIHVVAGSYVDNLTLTQNVAFVGSSFTMGNLMVAANANVSFAQTISVGILSLTGQMAMASGMSLTSATAHVVGNLSVSGNGAYVVSAMDFGLAGIVNFNNAQLIASSAGVIMNGTFALSNTWGSASVVGMSLPFSEDFELYGTGTVMTNLKFRGWNATAGTVLVTNGISQSGTKSVMLPNGTVISNSINSAGGKVWTDFYIRPELGGVPSAPETNTSSFVAYANSDGYLVVATSGGGWYVCSNQVNNTPAIPLQTNSFTRISICHDLSFNPPKFAVFVAGNLVAQGLSSPSSLSSYTSFSVDNQEGNAYLDDVLITTALPSDLTSDLDEDGIADAYEIHNYGLLTILPRGSVFKIR